MKYIDSEKLIAEIKRLDEKYRTIRVNGKLSEAREADLVIRVLHNISITITSLQQEQPEVDLEKFTDKIKTFQERYKYPEIVSIKGAMAFMARMFYQYPNIARQWYDSLPKVTMD